MPTLNSTDLRFTISVDKPSKEIVFTDVTDYNYWKGNEYASGLLKITDPVGNVIYENAGYSSNDYTSPDIIAEADIKNAVTGIVMDTDGSGNIIAGEYTIEYKVANYSADPTPITCDIAATATTKTFVITSISQADYESMITYGWLGPLTGNNPGSFKVVSSDFNAGTATIVVEGAIVNETSPGATCTRFDVPSTVQLIATKKFDYCYVPTTPNIGFIISCTTSELTSSDNTNYTGSNGVDSLPYYTLVRTHSVQAPIGSGYGSIPDSTAKVRIFSDIWTKIWQTSISSAVTYDVEKWIANEAQAEIVWYQIADVISGYDTANVNCQSCACDIRQDIRNLYLKWENSLCCSSDDTGDLEEALTKVNSLFIQYLQAERCGADTSEYCNEIAAVLKESDCSSSTVSDDSPSEHIESTVDYFGVRDADNDFVGKNTFVDLEMIGDGNGVVFTGVDQIKYKLSVNAGAVVVTAI
jgi:hypothetical protein